LSTKKDSEANKQNFPSNENDAIKKTNFDAENGEPNPKDDLPF